jgi:NAD(P)-dependent dehydrogenase (short-subunit alcohol dehydrogenase family)
MVAMDLELRGARVLITGASQGIGAALAMAFADHGCDLYLTALEHDALSDVSEQIRKSHDVRVTSQAVDLTAAGAVEEVATAAGSVDILVNNAGVVPSGSLWDIDADTWRRGWSLKGFGYADMIRAVYPGMKARGHGVILNNIGNGGEVCDPLYVEGAMANAGLMAVTRAVGGSSMDDGIRVVGINPGPVGTPRLETMLAKRAKAEFGDEARTADLLRRYPQGRPAHMQEITDLFLFLASRRAGYISGTIVTIDGGIAARRSIV